MIVNYTIIFTCYVYCISSKKNAGNVDIKENPNKEHFYKVRRIMILAMMLTLPLIFILPVKLIVRGEYFIQEGPAIIGSYLISGISVILWLVLIFSNQNNIKSKKFIPIYSFCIICLIAAVLQNIKPEICFITPSIIFITVLTFFTLENPDVHKIEK